MTFGIYLCINCARKHRSYGVHISFVRSLTLDRWTPKQIEFMKQGGNKRFRDLFEQNSHEFPDPHSYTCDLAEEYKAALKADVYKVLGLSDDTSARPPNTSGENDGSSSNSNNNEREFDSDVSGIVISSSSISSNDIFGEDFTKDMKRMDTSYGNRHCLGFCNCFPNFPSCTIL